MKRKELKKLLGHFLKLNANLTAPGQKNLTALQAKLHYLKIISELPSYGAKCFSTTLSVSKVYLYVENNFFQNVIKFPTRNLFCRLINMKLFYYHEHYAIIVSIS